MELIKQPRIGTLKLKNPFILAPMAGITDRVFRSICRDFGCSLAFTEMVSAKGLHHAGKNSISLLDTDLNEKPRGVQLFGSDPKIMAKQVASPIIQSFDIIDINMGCPARKIIQNGDGSALMRNLPLAQRVIESCVEASEKPIAVKFRAGWDKMSINAEEFARMAERAGAAALTIHARTVEQGYSGKADWTIIAKVKQAVNIPIVGNGDIFNAYDALEMMRKTSCDIVMIARGAKGNPWIFRDLEDLSNEKELQAISINDRIELILLHIEKMAQYFPERTVLLEMRKHIQWYLKRLTGAAFLRTHVYKAENIEELKEVVRKIGS